MFINYEIIRICEYFLCYEMYFFLVFYLNVKIVSIIEKMEYN